MNTHPFQDKTAVITGGASGVGLALAHQLLGVGANVVIVDRNAASLEQGRLFPPLPTIRSVSAHIAVAVANVAYEEGLATVARPDDLDATVRAAMYDATYPQHA